MHASKFAIEAARAVVSNGGCYLLNTQKRGKQVTLCLAEAYANELLAEPEPSLLLDEMAEVVRRYMQRTGDCFQSQLWVGIRSLEESNGGLNSHIRILGEWVALENHGIL